MSTGKKKKGNSKSRKKKDKKVGIKDIESTVDIKLQRLLEEDYPIFCFKHLKDNSIRDCEDPKFFYNFLVRLQKLSELGWTEIRKSAAHSFGMEPLPKSEIKPALPACVTPEVGDLHVFRANGNNLPFVGLQVGYIFRVFFIETEFGHIYDHKSK